MLTASNLLKLRYLEKQNKYYCPKCCRGFVSEEKLNTCIRCGYKGIVVIYEKDEKDKKRERCFIKNLVKIAKLKLSTSNKEEHVSTIETLLTLLIYKLP